MKTLAEIVADYYRNSPGWPLPIPDDREIDNEVALFMSDPCGFSAEDIQKAHVEFWKSEITARNKKKETISMKIAAILYHHRHGEDVLFFKTEEDKSLPEITNELLKRAGSIDPELPEGEGDDPQNEEWAEWIGPFEIDELPVL